MPEVLEKTSISRKARVALSAMCSRTSTYYEQTENVSMTVGATTANETQLADTLLSTVWYFGCSLLARA